MSLVSRGQGPRRCRLSDCQQQELLLSLPSPLKQRRFSWISSQVIEEFHSANPQKLLSACMLLALALIATACGGPSYPKCDEDDDCHKGEYCVDSRCEQCRSADDCSPGQTCNSGVCETDSTYCTSQNDCSAGKNCEDNHCVDSATSAKRRAHLDTSFEAGGAGQCELAPLYFDYDSSVLSDQAREQLSRNAQCARQRGARGLHLTGMTDQRGTEEYNLALGERRAQAAASYLRSLGTGGEITSSSVGEELATGADETGWARDRRVDFKLK